MAKIILNEEASKPSAPASGQLMVYAKTDDDLYVQNSAGVETQINSFSAIDALTGDVTATGPGSVAATLATVNSNVGTFPKVTVNGKGLVTAATTLSSGDIPNNAANTSGTASNITASSNSSLTTLSSLSLPYSQLTGTPSLSSYLINSNNLSDVSSRQTSLNNISGAVTSGQYLRGNGTNILMSAIQVADVPTLNQNTTGTASNITASSNSSLTTLSSLSLPFSQLSGSATAAQMPAFTGDITTSAGSTATTLATVNSNVGSFGSSTSIPSFTVNGKGLVTAASGNAVIAPAGTLTGSTLSSGVTASSLTSVGTIGTGTWNGSLIGATYGGLGNGTWTTYGIPFYNGSSFSDGSTNLFYNNSTGVLGINNSITFQGIGSDVITTTQNPSGNGGSLSIGTATSAGGFTSGNMAFLPGNGGAGTSGTGGSAGAVNFTGGIGGLGTGSATINLGGAGGAFAMIGGAGGGAVGSGATANSAGSGGGVTITSGAGGTHTTGPASGFAQVGNGGNVTISTATGGSGVTGVVNGGNAGTLALTSASGAPGGAGKIGGNGGTYNIIGGVGGTASQTSAGTNTGGNGSVITIVAGNSGGASNGATNASGTPGYITMNAGSAGAASGGASTQGGRIALQTGAGTNSGLYGNILLNQSGGLVGIGVAPPLSKFHVVNDIAANVGAIVKGAASQSADLTEWQNSSSTVLAKVDSSGNASFPAIKNTAAQTTLTGSAGTAICSQPEQGSSYKKVVCYLSGYTDTSTQTFTFPTAFTNTPYVYGLSTIVSGATTTSTTVKFTTTTLSGFFFAEGY